MARVSAVDSSCVLLSRASRDIWWFLMVFDHGQQVFSEREASCRGSVVAWRKRDGLIDRQVRRHHHPAPL